MKGCIFFHHGQKHVPFVTLVRFSSFPLKHILCFLWHSFHIFIDVVIDWSRWNEYIRYIHEWKEKTLRLTWIDSLIMSYWISFIMKWFTCMYVCLCLRYPDDSSMAFTLILCRLSSHSCLVIYWYHSLELCLNDQRSLSFNVIFYRISCANVYIIE